MFGACEITPGAIRMWMKSIALAAALAASLDLAWAQSVDPDPANRGYPAYAQPGVSGYYNGVPHGNSAGAAAPGVHNSRPAGLPKRR
jgi:uncharacterized membrane protein